MCDPGAARNDPQRAQDFFCPSSEGWPPFMRVNPILNWAYEDVWAYLRAAGAQHCELYDRGYTSLGSVATTAPNSALRRTDGTYAPACKLAGLMRRRSSVRQTCTLACLHPD